jgi:hypothetical protein
MGTYIASELNKIYVEDVQYTASVSESVGNKIGATVNYLADNAQLTDPQVYSQVFSTVGTHTFTVPAGVTRVKIRAVGGGGGGSTAADGSNSGGSEFAAGAGGGGAGGYVESVAIVIPLTGYSVVVGGGGATNTAGTQSSFDGSIIAYGGASGGAGSYGGGGAGGAGGSGVGSFVVSGDDGYTGEYAGGTPASATGGLGGKSMLSPRNTAANGKLYGSGGKGANANNSGSTGGSGTGAAGVVIVEWVA